FAKARRPISLSVHQVQIFGSQRGYDRTAHGLGYGLVLLPRIRPILLIGFAHSFDAFKAYLQIRGLDASRDKSRAYIAQLLLIQERTAGRRHDVVFGFIIDDGAFSSRGLFT